jgi:hypothetical protein
MEKQLKDILEKSRRINQKRLTQLRQRDRLMPCISEYDALLTKLQKEKNCGSSEKEGLSYLTSIFRGTYHTVLAQIKDSGKEGINAINAIKRSAGTNYQGVCEYSIIRWILTTNLPFIVGPNAPPKIKDELTIYGFDADGGEFSVEPDIDISLWVDDGQDNSPLIIVSAKTSLVDRAGQAARWKMYLDMHQTTCPHTSNVSDCPINRTRIKIKTKHPITHAIVTANIYKIDTTQPYGELVSGQCRNNTYMFEHKYTTRNDKQEVRPPSWKSFSEFPNLVENIARTYFGVNL